MDIERPMWRFWTAFLDLSLWIFVLDMLFPFLDCVYTHSA